MNLFELFVKIGVDDQASGKIKDIGSKLGSGLKTAAKVGAAAIGVASTAIAALTTQAVNNFAEFQQLAGGAELMFGEAFETVMNNASEAYRTVQMSQNEYLQQVNGFATGLKTALGGNEQAAADLAHRIIQAEADIVAATGNTQENVQNAFNGIMKSNFTMLDNLQIGITPTKEGFQEVIDKVNEWNATMGNATNYQMGNLADMQSALVDYIEMQGLAGYASNEASHTISGSLASTKAAWSNLVTGVADDNADFEKLIDDFVDSVGTTAENVIPRVEKALEGTGKLVERLVPVIINRIPEIVQNTLPKILQSGVNIIRTILDGISSNPDQIVSTIMRVVNTLIDAIIDLLPEIIVTGSLLLGKLAVGIIQAIPELVAKIPQIIKSVVDGFKAKSDDFSGIGKDIVNGVWKGISSMIKTFTKNVKDFFSGIVDSVKKTLGIKSPSRVFAEIGGFMAKGLDKGWEEEFGDVKKDIDNSLYFDDAHIGIGASVRSFGSGTAYGGTSIGNITINIDGAKYSDEQSLASAIAFEIQNMTDRRAAVYA